MPLNLNNQKKELIALGEESALLEYYPHFLSEDPFLLIQYFQELKENLLWQQDQITLYGKTHNVPRLQTWYSEEGLSYTYSGIRMESKPFYPLLEKICDQLKRELGIKVNSVLCNLYRNGDDYVAWHSDDEKELGPCPTICSLSLGESRRFSLRHKENKNEKLDIFLHAGDLLVMSGNTQEFYHHQIARSKNAHGERINLTFRDIIIDI